MASITAPVCSIFIPAPAIGQLRQLCEKGTIRLNSGRTTTTFSRQRQDVDNLPKGCCEIPRLRADISNSDPQPGHVNRLELRDALAAAGVFSEQETKIDSAHKVVLTFKGAS